MYVLLSPLQCDPDVQLSCAGPESKQYIWGALDLFQNRWSLFQKKQEHKSLCNGNSETWVSDWSSWSILQGNLLSQTSNIFTPRPAADPCDIFYLLCNWHQLIFQSQIHLPSLLLSLGTLWKRRKTSRLDCVVGLNMSGDKQQRTQL